MTQQNEMKFEMISTGEIETYIHKISMFAQAEGMKFGGFMLAIDELNKRLKSKHNIQFTELKIDLDRPGREL